MYYNPNHILTLAFDQLTSQMRGRTISGKAATLDFIPPCFLLFNTTFGPVYFNPASVVAVGAALSGGTVALDLINGDRWEVLEDISRARLIFQNIWRQQYEGQPAYAPLHHTHKKGE